MEPKRVEADLLENDIFDYLTAIRGNRTAEEQRWLQNRRVWASRYNSETHFVASDTSSARDHVPFVRKAIERTVTRAAKLLTPNTKWFEATPLSETDPVLIADTDEFMQYVLRNKIRSKTNISQLCRCMILYNRCHLKTSPIVVNGQVWPMQRVVDPFSFYVSPDTAVSLEEADLVFEDILMSFERYNALAVRGIFDAIEPSSLATPDWPYHLVDRLSEVGIGSNRNETLPSYEKVRDYLNKMKRPYVSLSELWTYRNDRLYKGYIVWNHKMRPRLVAFRPSILDEPLYRSAVQRSLPNELYGPSMADDMRSLDGRANDLFNKFIEAVDREQGMVFADGSVRTDSWKFGGGNVWDMANPRDDAIFVQPGVTSPTILRAFQIVYGMIQSMGATGTIAEGQPGRNMPRAGSAVESLISLGMADTKDISELIEKEVLTLSLNDIHRVAVLFIPDEQLIKIPGGKSISGDSVVFEGRDIKGDYSFEWVGSLQFQDEQIQAQRALIFLNMLPTMQAMIQQQGYTINAVELIRYVWRYSLGNRGLKDIVVRQSKLEQKTYIDSLIDQSSNGAEKGMSGLQYSLPSLLEGFVSNR